MCVWRSMGTTGTIMGTSRFLKERNPDVRIIGLQPEEGASIPGGGAQGAGYRAGVLGGHWGPGMKGTHIPGVWDSNRGRQSRVRGKASSGG